MRIEELQITTLKRILEVEKRKEYNTNLPLDEVIKRRYNVSRSLDDYCIKFPSLHLFLKKSINFLEIGIGEGIAFKSIINKYQLYGTATNFNADKDSNVIKAVASDLPFDDNYFDLVISIHSITWEPNQQKAIREVLRVLKSGGKAFINLYKFSEISTLWFGEDFWKEFSKTEYQSLYEFNETNYASPNFVIKIEPQPDISELSNNYFIEISKP